MSDTPTPHRLEDLVHGRTRIEYPASTGTIVSAQPVTTVGAIATTGPNGSKASTFQHTQTDITVEKSDGQHIQMRVPGNNVCAIPGQQATLVAIRKQGTDKTLPAIFVNITTGQHWFVHTAQDINATLQIEHATGRRTGLYVAIAWILALLITAPQYNILLATQAAGIVLIYRIIRRVMRTNAFHRRLKKHLEDTAQRCYHTP